jgi:hypothetical protein
MNNFLSKQDRFLLLGSRITLSDAECTTFDELIDSIDNWAFILQKAIELNISSLLYKNCIKSKNKSLIPANVLNDLRKMYIKILIRNTKMNADFKALMQLLTYNSIEFIPLKGMYLNFEVYGDFGLRLMSDVDLMIKENEIQKTKELMLNNGWKINRNAYRTKIHDEVDRIVSHHPYILGQDQTIIELHAGIHPTYKSYNVNTTDYWQRSHESELMGLKSQSLNNADALQHLCLHTYNDLSGKKYSLKLFVDITEFLKKFEQEIDWKLLETTCTNYNCVQQVQQTLKICKLYFNAPVNAEFMNYKVSSSIKNIDLEKLFLNIFSKNAYAVLFNIVYGQYVKLYIYREIKGFKPTLTFLRGYIFPSAEFVYEKFTKQNRLKIHFRLYRFLKLINQN